jgi:hypothetical protein
MHVITETGLIAMAIIIGVKINISKTKSSISTANFVALCNLQTGVVGTEYFIIVASLVSVTYLGDQAWVG